MARKNRPGLILLALAAGLACARAPAAPGGPADPALEVCVYYDVGKDPGFMDGQLHAIMLENLLGHFKEVRPRLLAAERFRKGDLKACDRTAYIGSYYGAALPLEFLRGVEGYRKPFLWINYNIEQLQKRAGRARFSRRFGFEFMNLRGFDATRRPGEVPDFYRFFEYKGERFMKLAIRRPQDDALVADPEIAVVRAGSARVLALAVHSGTGERTPYVVEKSGFFYVADNPFLYIHEQDRYLILADLLFDFLSLAPRDASRHALVRLEDVHPATEPATLHRVVELLRKRKVPFALSLIPEYVPGGGSGAGVSIAQRPRFLEEVRYAQANGGDILLHGLTHNADNLKDCPPLDSGADYEFWDRCRQSALPYDSAEFVRARIGKAREFLAGAGLSEVGWVTPHYAASAADFTEFGALFDRTLQRVRYSLESPQGKEAFVSQFFPYTIYRDHYGQFVWPEDLGFVPLPGFGRESRTPEDMASSSRLLWVVRDGWASFFWHPQLIDSPGEAERLEGLLDSIRARGFEFVSLADLRSRGQ